MKKSLLANHSLDDEKVHNQKNATTAIRSDSQPVSGEEDLSPKLSFSRDKQLLIWSNNQLLMIYKQIRK